MSEEEKTREQLIREIAEVRARLAELKKDELSGSDEASWSEAKPSQEYKAYVAFLEGARAVMRYRQFEAAARSIFDSSRNLITARAGYVALLADNDTENEVVFLDPGGFPCSAGRGHRTPIRGIRGEAYKTKEAVYHNDFLKSPWMRFVSEGHIPLENVLLAPMIMEDKTVGLLAFANKLGGFTDEDARMAVVFGQLAAVALLNTRTLHSLQTSEKRFLSLAETANDAVIWADSSGKVVFWNRAAVSMFGYSVNEAMGKPLALVLAEKCRKTYHDRLKRVASNRTSEIIRNRSETVGLTKNGNEFPIELTIGTFKLKEGPFFTHIVRDITERKRAESALLEQTLQNELILQTAIDGFCLVDHRGRILKANHMASVISGYSQEEMAGIRFRDLGILDNPRGTERHIRRIIEKGSDRFEARCHRKGGSVVDLEVSGNAVSTGDDTFLFLFFHDITERKQSHQALLERERELRTKTETLEEVNTALRVLLKRREEDKGELEEKMMLNVKERVSPYVEKLLHGTLTESQRAYVNIITSNLKDLISPFSLRLTSKALSLTPAEMQVADLVKYGRTSKEIARLLNLSVQTVETHRKHIREKLGIRKRKANLRTHLMSLEE